MEYNEYDLNAINTIVEASVEYQCTEPKLTMTERVNILGWF